MPLICVQSNAIKSTGNVVTASWQGASGSSRVASPVQNQRVNTTPIQSSGVLTGTPNLMLVTTKAAGPITVRVRGGCGTTGNGGSLPGVPTELSNVVSPALPAGTDVVFYAGNGGYIDYTTVAGDGTAGGGGGFSLVMYADAAGKVTWNSRKWTVLALANGSGGGNDSIYQGKKTTGTTYSTTYAPRSTSPSGIEGWLTTGFQNNTGIATTSFTRVGKNVYGGWPGGLAADDAVSPGGGPGYNYSASDAFNAVSVTSAASGSPGIVEITGAI